VASTFYALLAASLLAQGDYPMPAPAPGVAGLAAPGWHGPPGPLPLPMWAPVCDRLQATTNVWLSPIPMPLDIMSDPYPTVCQRWRAWKASHRAGHGTSHGN